MPRGKRPLVAGTQLGTESPWGGTNTPPHGGAGDHRQFATWALATVPMT